MKIRKAKIKDAKYITKVNIDVWNTTYRGIMTDEDLDNLSYEKKEKLCKELIKDKENSFLYVAEDNKRKIIGFVSGGRERGNDNRFDCEIYAIYVLKEFQGKGIGRLLFKEAVKKLKDSNFKSLKIWVLKSNPYRRFYEKLGGSQVDAKNIKGLDATAFGWNNIKNII